MLAPQQFLLFLTAATVLAITPGPGLLYVLARSVAGGRRVGLLSSLGTFVGGFAHVLAAAAGLSVVLATSALAFALVKYAGAAYLIYLGVQMIRGARQDCTIAVQPEAGDPFRQGILTEVLNPKTALFFLSFIPQFVDRNQGSAFAQFVLLGTISVFLNTLCDVLVVFLAVPLSRRLQASAALRRRQRVATGGAMVALGAYVAASDAA